MVEDEELPLSQQAAARLGTSIVLCRVASQHECMRIHLRPNYAGIIDRILYLPCDADLGLLAPLLDIYTLAFSEPHAAAPATWASFRLASATLTQNTVNLSRALDTMQQIELYFLYDHL